MLPGAAGSARRLLAVHLAAGRMTVAESNARTISSQEQECGGECGAPTECCDPTEEENLRTLCPKRCPPGPRGCPGQPVPFRNHCCKEPPPPPCCVCPHSIEPAPRGCSECKLPPVPAPCCARPEHHRAPGDGPPTPYSKWIIFAVGGAAAIGLAAYAASSLSKQKSEEECKDAHAFDPCDPCGCEKKSRGF